LSPWLNEKGVSRSPRVGFEVVLSFAFCGNAVQQKLDPDLTPRSPAMRVKKRLQRCNFAPFATSLSAISLILISLVLTCSQPANALPAFARKYGLRC
jgi:hypothetical protein